MPISNSINPETIHAFRRTVWDYYRGHKRDMPWRHEPTPYFVLVSEIMLQQTQVARVRQKFATFIRRFPDFRALALAPLADVLQVWSGLGYNRRAKFLWQAAQMVVNEYNGDLPHTQQELLRLPGIGPNTAGAILAYAFNEPTVFIETNIRTVFIHHFFENHPDTVNDTELRNVVAAALPPESPREWYWALMDYGTHLKATIGSQLDKVKHYRPQSKFEGSRRQVRGRVLREILARQQITQQELALYVVDDRLPEVVDALLAEGLLIRRGDLLQLTA